MKVLEIRPDSLLVTTNMGKTAIARYEDGGGIFFYNEKLDKEYVSESNTVEKEHPFKEVVIRPNKKNTYTFDVVTSNKWGEPSRHYRKSVKAETLEIAFDKIENNYKNIFDVELVKFVNKIGRNLDLREAR